MTDKNDGGLHFMIGFFLVGFVCFVVAITIYLRREDTQWHKTVAMIKNLTDMQINDKYSTDNTLKTMTSVVDQVRLDHTKEIINMRLSHEAEVSTIRSKLTEVSSHLEHLRKEHHKIQIMMTQMVQIKKSQMDIIKSQADLGTDKLNVKATAKSKNTIVKRKLINGKNVKVRARRSNASH